jgi:hypothetical protein
LLFILFAFSSINAQKRTISLGPEIGTLIEPIRSNEALGNSFHLGVNGGLHLKYIINDQFSVSLKTLVSTRKKSFFYETSYREESRINEWIETLGPLFGIDTGFAMFDTNNSFIKITTYNKFNGSHRQLFIDFPITANYTYQNFSVYGGFYVSLLLRNETVTEMYSETPALDLINTDSFPEINLVIELLFPNHRKTEVNYNVSKNNLINLDYGIIAGVSYNVNQLYFYARYMMGFPDYRVNNEGDNKYANHLIQSGIGYTFPFSGNKLKNTPSLE